jgi:hypothetical protein
MATVLRRETMQAAILSVFLLSSVAAFALGRLSDIVMDVMIAGAVLAFAAFTLTRPEANANPSKTAAYAAGQTLPPA